nr:nitrate reductase (EC 1.7.99.4) nasA - Klebsiella pneumoniae [Klebsiella pneumoniae]
MTETRTTCPYCGVGCGVIASRAPHGQVSVRGDEQHPANFGRLCVKGAALGETVGLEDRMLFPEVDGERATWPQAGGGRFAPAGDYRSARGQAVRFTSGQLLTEDYYAANKLMKGFIGAANIDTNSRLCMSSAVTGYKRARWGTVVPCSYEDVENSDLVVLVGSNAAWAHPVLYQRLAQAKRDNPQMRVVVIDPRRTATCDIADRHLALAPGSDGGLFVGLLNAIAASRRISDDFNDAQRALTIAQDWDLDKVAQFCGLPRQQIADFYREFIAAPRAITLYTMGINQSASGSDKCNAIINVHLACGKYGRPGCGPFSLTGQPNAMGGREVGGLATMLAAHMNFEPDDLRRPARFWGSERLAQTGGLTGLELFAAIGRGEVKAVWIMGTNAMVSLPGTSHAVTEPWPVSLVIISDVADTDTGRFAHIRFPALAWGEKSGTVTNSERRISLQRAFMPPPGEARAAGGLSPAGRGLASALPGSIRTRCSANTPRFQGMKTMASGRLISADWRISAATWIALEPVRWPVSRSEAAWSVHKGWHRDGKLRMVPVAPQPTRATTVASIALLNADPQQRADPRSMAHHDPHPAVRLMQHINEPVVEVPPAEPQRYHLLEGELARVRSPKGVMVAKVTIGEANGPGSLFVPMHWNNQFARQGRVNNLLAAVTDPHSGQPESKQTAVAIATWLPAWKGELFSRQPVPLPCRCTGGGGRPRALSIFRWPGDTPSRDWLVEWCQRQGWQMQVAEGGKVWNLLAWRAGELMLGWWSDASEPAISASWIHARFVPPQNAARAHALLSGRKGGVEMPRGRIICSCFSVGERAIGEAIAGGCRSPGGRLGGKLKCGTNCGSCIPELKALLAANVAQA